MWLKLAGRGSFSALKLCEAESVGFDVKSALLCVSFPVISHKKRSYEAAAFVECIVGS